MFKWVKPKPDIAKFEIKNVVYFLSCCLGLITLCNFIIGKWVALVDFVPFFSLGVALCN